MNKHFTSVTRQPQSNRAAQRPVSRACVKHHPPRAALPPTDLVPRAAGIRRERVLKTTHEEHRAPAAAVVAPQLEVVLLARHAGHDVAYSAPGVEAAM